MTATGCDACLAWHEQMPLRLDRNDPSLQVESSFTGSGLGYTDAYLLRCERCGAFWLEGYVEDFVGLPIEAEWGNRWWTLPLITPEMAAEVEQAAGTHSLDLKTFAAAQPGDDWAN